MIVFDDGEDDFNITYDPEKKVLEFSWDENGDLHEILKDWTEEDFYNYFHNDLALQKEVEKSDQ